MKSHTELRGVAADDNALVSTIAAPRQSMVYAHKKSAVAPDFPDLKLHFTGAGREYYKYCFNDVVGHDGNVVEYIAQDGRAASGRIKRTPHKGGGETLSEVIFFRRQSSSGSGDVIDVVEVGTYTVHDNVFGNQLKPTDKLKNLRAHDRIEAGDALTITNSQKGKEFADGVNLLTTTMSHPDIIEDSYLISDRAAAKMHAYGYKRYFVPLRDGDVLLNKYGTPEHPKYFPEVGEAIRDDGLVLAVRRYDKNFGALDMSSADLMEHSTYYDSCHHCDADPLHLDNHDNPETGSRVCDIRVWRNEAAIDHKAGGEEVNKIRSTHDNIRVLDRTAMGLKHYYRQIIELYLHFVKQSRGKEKFTPQATRLICEALASESAYYSRQISELTFQNIQLTAVERMYQYTPITHYTIEIVVRYPIPVTVSSKITDESGTKGIVGAVRPLHEMPYCPILQDYVDVVRSSNAVPRRSTYAGIYHIKWDAASLQLRNRLEPMLETDLYGAWEIFLDYMSRYNPQWAEVLRATYTTDKEIRDLFAWIKEHGTRIWLPHELDTTPLEITENLGEYAPEKTPLQITNYRGEKEWTVDSFYVGNVYTLRLDKHGREFFSTSSMRVNYLDMISMSGPNERDSRPVNDKANKYGGESERRLLSGFGGKVFDLIHYRANCVDAHYGVVRGLYESYTPSNPGDLLGVGDKSCLTSTAHKLISHSQFCEGIAFVRPRKEK